MATFGLWHQEQWLKNEVGSLFCYPKPEIAQQAIDRYFRDKDGIEIKELNLEELFPGKRHTCPRRAEGGSQPSETENLDIWETTTGMAGGMEAEHCSYCGSIHPDMFLELIQQGAEIIPTDKTYKAYIKGEGKTNKFYFQHLNPDHRQAFVDLINSGQMNIGYPGRFYVLPYFVRIQSL